MQNVALGFGQFAGLMRLREQDVQLFGRVNLAMAFGGVQSEEPQQEVADSIEQPNQRREQSGAQRHRTAYE